MWWPSLMGLPPQVNLVFSRDILLLVGRVSVSSIIKKWRKKMPIALAPPYLSLESFFESQSVDHRSNRFSATSPFFLEEMFTAAASTTPLAEIHGTRNWKHLRKMNKFQYSSIVSLPANWKGAKKLRRKPFCRRTLPPHWQDEKQLPLCEESRCTQLSFVCWACAFHMHCRCFWP